MLEQLNTVLAHLDVVARFVFCSASSLFAHRRFAVSLQLPSTPRSRTSSLPSWRWVCRSCVACFAGPLTFGAGEGSLLLTESRHPCLEVQDGVNFIANDISLERGTFHFSLALPSPDPFLVFRRQRVPDHHRTQHGRQEVRPRFRSLRTLLTSLPAPSSAKPA